MAATYRIIISSINCYNSVVIDRRVQHTVHYCNGPCGALKHGLNCTVAHRSTCAELLEAPYPTLHSLVPHEPTSKSLDNGNSGPGTLFDDYHQAIPGRLKKGSITQSTGSLKDITGEAINLASGKIKEFSFEKIKYSSSHVTFRKGRKVRPDSFSRRSTDLDIIYGHFSGNDENCPPFGLLQKSVLEEHKLSRSTSLEHNLNNVATVYLNSLTEENLIARILEKTKTDSNASGEDIRACLDILLKCSEDLKKCTDIIKQCIKRKSMGGDADGDTTNPETIYKNVMSRLSSYLKKLPLEFDQGRSEHNDLAELLSTLHGLQQGPFSPIFNNEQPPRYEDVVQSPPPSKAQPNSSSSTTSSSSSQTDPHEIQRDFTENAKFVQNHVGISARVTSTANGLQTSSPASSSGTLSHLNNHHDAFPSTNSLLSGSSDSICKDTMEALYIEEDSDVGRLPARGMRGDRNDLTSPGSTGLEADKPSETIRNGLRHQPKAVPDSGPYLPSRNMSADLRSFPRLTSRSAQSGSEDIDKLLLDLECLSQNMQKEPPLPPKLRAPGLRTGCHQQTVGPQNLSSYGPVDKTATETPVGTLPKAPEACGGTQESNEEDDGALLLRILESIESFAQELVESGAGKGAQSKEWEVMRLLQDTLTTTTKMEAMPEAAPTGSTLLIQQTPEVIRVQNKPEKKPGTPPLSPTPATSTPTPCPGTPPPSCAVVVTPPPIAVNIPRFYFPKGLPNCSANYDEAIAKIETAFADFEEEKADIYEMGKIAKACGCPLYWKAAMFNGAGGERTGFVSVHSFIATWRKLLHSCYDDASKFVYLLAKPGFSILEQEDFIPLLQDIVDTHPGLTFLKDAPEFHSRYITTVIQRIFYTVNRSWTGKITLTELRRSNFLQTLALLEEEDDINQITDYFSYEHFYVIYCKFWELDTDHDLFIDPKDLARYNDHASSNRIIERLFSGAVTRGNSVQKEGRMSYAEFVWFLISEEDKKNLTSIEYWFRCMDLDGDGVLSMYELEFFYEEQCERMEGMGIEPLPFHDLLCQMLDLVKPECQGKITLRDLKRCRMAHIFFDTFFNLEKYLDHEQRDPFAVQKDVESDGPEPSDWDKYASEEYEILVAEETHLLAPLPSLCGPAHPKPSRLGSGPVTVEARSPLFVKYITPHVFIHSFDAFIENLSM
uniref:EF-hand domain-containing protein n=1 Tax=Denticeps clupeoides TaxID=299321 RepID=A0AAY4AEZ0_9TELE